MTTNMGPIPAADALTEPYWDALRKHRFLLPRCETCDRFHFYPRARCPCCDSGSITWSEASGRGTVYSFTHVHRAPSPAFEKDLPYVVAVVELEEGPHLMSSLVNCRPDEVRIGQLVAVCFFDRGEVTLAAFEPVRREDGLPVSIGQK